MFFFPTSPAALLPSRAIDRFMMDPVANTLAVIVLLAMLVSAVSVLIIFLREQPSRLEKLPQWLLPVLALLGLGVAIYLSVVELSHTEAFCGPIGNCNRVQQSKYAYLFDLIPIGLVGVAGYLAILAAWLLSRLGPEKVRSYASMANWVFAWLGLLFSIYLTFLEPFVIGATCAWCLTSAVVMMLLLWSSTGAARIAWRKLEDALLEDEQIRE